MSRRLVAVAALAWAYMLSANGEELVVVVNKVLSGNTLIVRGPREILQVTIFGIAAPAGTLAYGEESKESLLRLTKGRDVRLDCIATDKDRVKICRAYVGENDLGLMQVQSGMAQWHRASAGQQTESDRAAYEKAESQAKAGKLGLWGD